MQLHYFLQSINFIKVADPIKELVEPAVQGTKTVLESATKAGTVKRVVVTSSVAAIAGKRPPGHVYTVSREKSKPHLYVSFFQYQNAE